MGGLRRPPAATAASALASSLRRRIVSPSSLCLSHVVPLPILQPHSLPRSSPDHRSQSEARRRLREERKSPRCNRLPCGHACAPIPRPKHGPTWPRRPTRSTYIQFTEECVFLYPLLFFDSYLFFFLFYRPCFSAFHPAAHRAHGPSLNTRCANSVGILLRTINFRELKWRLTTLDHASALLCDLIGPIEVLSSYRSHIGVVIRRCYEETVLAGFRPIICRIGRFPGNCIVHDSW